MTDPANIYSEIDVADLIAKLSFSSKQVADAARRNPTCYLQAAKYRVQKMRKVTRRKAKLALLQSQYSAKVRAEIQSLGQRDTQALVTEKMSRIPILIEWEEKVAEAEREEEFAKHLLSAYHMCRDAVKVCAELVGAEIYVARKMDDGGTELESIRENIKKKYSKAYPKRTKRELGD